MNREERHAKYWADFVRLVEQEGAGGIFPGPEKCGACWEPLHGTTYEHALVCEYRPYTVDRRWPQIRVLIGPSG